MSDDWSAAQHIVLVVDDNRNNRDLIGRRLERAGYQVLFAENGPEGLDAVDERPIDLVILDVMMPRVSGWDLLDELRQQEETKTTPVLMLSALGDVSHRVRGLRGGADDYLVKPFEREEIVARVEGLVARQQPDLDGLQGRLESNPLAEVLQSLELNGKSGSLSVISGEQRGRVLLGRGKLMEAELNGVEGLEAVLELVQWESGRFTFRPAEVGGGATLALGSVQGVLLESAWLKDELSSRADYLPGLDEPLRLTGKTPPITGDFATLPIGEVMEVIGNNPGTSLEGLQSLGMAATPKLRLIVAWLLAEGAAEAGPPVLTEVSEEEDAALRELFQTALQRGLRLEDLCVSIWFQRPTWPSVLALLLNLRDALLPTRDRRAKRNAIPVGGRLHLRHECGSVMIKWAELDELQLERDGGGDWNLLWLGPEFPPERLPLVLSRLEDAGGSEGGLLLTGDPLLARQLSRDTDGRGEWHVRGKLPESLKQVLMLLL